MGVVFRKKGDPVSKFLEKQGWVRRRRESGYWRTGLRPPKFLEIFEIHTRFTRFVRDSSVIHNLRAIFVNCIGYRGFRIRYTRIYDNPPSVRPVDDFTAIMKRLLRPVRHRSYVFGITDVMPSSSIPCNLDDPRREEIRLWRYPVTFSSRVGRADFLRLLLTRVLRTEMWLVIWADLTDVPMPPCYLSFVLFQFPLHRRSSQSLLGTDQLHGAPAQGLP